MAELFGDDSDVDSFGAELCGMSVTQAAGANALLLPARAANRFIITRT
jgi:hypothetical protein